jgi:hypothetical protein
MARRAAVTTRPPWCGRCDEQTRMTGDDAPRRCLACHPLAPVPAATSALAAHQVAQMRERDLQQAVTDLCALLGLEHFHVRNSRGMARGWPDSVIIGTAVLYRELKTETGALSPEQRRVGSKLTRAGADWAVWRPRDLRSGVVERQLCRIATGRGATS